MKLTLSLIVSLLLVPLCSFSQQKNSSGPTAKTIYNHTKNYILDHKKDGYFKVYDNVSNRTLNLKKYTEIRYVKCDLGDDQYYNCATFDAKDGNSYDIDFFFTWDGDTLDTDHVILHKTNSKPRYVWYINKNTGLWDALTVCGVDSTKKWEGSKEEIDRHLTTSPIVFNQDKTRPVYVWYKDKNSGQWLALKVCNPDKDIERLYK